MMQRIIYIVLVWCVAATAYSQTPSRLVFKFNGLRQENRVVLRWMLDDAAQWRYANEKGYIIERADAGSNNYVKLTAQPLKAMPRTGLAAYDSASPVFIATSFVLNPPKEDSMRGRKDDQMYSFYFLTASYETQAAVQSASGFIDSTVQPGKAYTYRITVAEPRSAQDTASWSAPATAQVLPPAPPVQAVFSNRKAELNWNIKSVAEQYFATVIEKSKGDSLHFARFSIPTIKVRTHVQSTAEDFEVNFTDNIENGEAVYYRIKGLNLFGITGASSNIVSGMASPDLTADPVIASADVATNNEVLLKWTLTDSVKPAVARYEIWQSTRFDSGYHKVAEVKAGVPFLQQSQVKALPINYFIVKAIGTRQGQLTASQPFMYQLIDSIAPVAPLGLTGKVDTNGVVTLTWKSNTEADLLGYRILKGASQKDEFVPLNATPGNSTTFHDTLSLRQLNKSVYYKIAAVDQRYNESILSAAIEVKRPDKIPPAPARLQGVSYSNGRLVITWKPSFSQDVVSYKLFRKASDDTSHAWKSLAIVKNTDTIYADKDVKENVQYSYAIQAVDDANLNSEMSPAAVGSVPSGGELKKGVRNLNTYVSRQYKYIELNWQSGDDAASEYWLYKAAGAGKLSLIATLPVATKKYVDEDLRPSTHYRYAIKIVYKNGTGSQLEKTEVAY